MKRIFLLIMFLISPFLICNAQDKLILTSDSVKLYVKVQGSGPVCLYIHGGPGAGSYSMEKFFGEYIEKSFTVIYLDQRGSGRSTSPKDGNYSVERILLDFEEVREFLGVEQWITLGHSFGGILQMAYINSYPKSIKGMLMLNCTLSFKDILINSWIPKARELSNVEKKILITDSKDTILEELFIAAKAMSEKGEGWKMSFNSKANYDLMNLSYDDISDFNYDFSSLALNIDDFWIDYRDLSSEIKVPVLFYYGTKDWNIGENHYKGIKFPNMVLWGSETGHFPFIENIDDLVRAIDYFLDNYPL